MDVSNRTYHIKDDPYFAVGARIVADFVSANHEFNELSIGEYEGDTEIWYIDRDDSSASVLAYANGQWEIEYRYITFGANVSLSDSDFQTLTWAYDQFIEPKRLRITYQGTTKLATINGMLKGSFACAEGVFPFDNRSKWPTPEISLDGSALSTPIVEGVTKYKVYSNGSLIGYIDPDGTWHGEVMPPEPPEPSGFTVTLTYGVAEVGNDGSTKIKFGTPPTSWSDYDYVTSWSYDTPRCLYDKSGNSITSPVTIENVTTCYIFHDDGCGSYRIVEGTANILGSSYETTSYGSTASDYGQRIRTGAGDFSNPDVVTLTSDVTLKIMATED